MDFNARQYDPQIGRFLGVDPLAASQGQEVFSPYAAMGNEPESMVDPNGEAFGNGIYRGLAMMNAFSAFASVTIDGKSSGIPAGIMSYLNGSSGKLDFDWGDAGGEMSADDFWGQVTTAYDLLVEGFGASGSVNGNGEFVVNYLGAGLMDGDQSLSFTTSDNGQKIYDKPSSGAVTYLGVTYNLNSFEGFYNKYHNKFRALTVGGDKIDAITDFKEDLIGKTPFSEAGTFLTMINGRVSTGENSDPTRKGTSFMYNKVNLSDMFKPLNSLYVTLHIHPDPNVHVTYYFNNSPQGFMNSMGPSQHDYMESWMKTNVRNVIIDRSYIYLVGHEGDPTIIFKR